MLKIFDCLFPFMAKELKSFPSTFTHKLSKKLRNENNSPNIDSAHSQNFRTQIYSKVLVKQGWEWRPSLVDSCVSKSVWTLCSMSECRVSGQVGAGKVARDTICS